MSLDALLLLQPVKDFLPKSSSDACNTLTALEAAAIKSHEF